MKKKNFLIPLLLGVCIHHTDAISAVLSPISITSQNICPGNTFEEFALNFSNNQRIQEQYTHIPLVKIELEEGSEEPESVKKLLTGKEVIFPVIDNENNRISKGLEVKIIDNGLKFKKIKLFKPDSGYQVYYFFEEKNKCWHLIEIDDQSI
jgi:hypothetical protein